MTEKEIKDAAFEFKVDYKPWEENLSPQDYGQYGFEQGMKAALKIPDIHYNHKLVKMKALADKLSKLMADPDAFDAVWHVKVRTAIEDLHHLMNQKEV